MSIKFNDTTYYKGLVQLFESEIGVDHGYISGDTTRLKDFTAEVNLALDRYLQLASQKAGTWELDSSNQTDYPNIYINIVSGQSDYAFINDANGNTILDIYKILILPSATATRYQEIYPVDENQSENLAIIDESATPGIPTRYAKRANAIFFDTSPNYSATRGIKILINREAYYFVYTNTDEKSGFPYHNEYFYLRPAFNYARRHGLAVKGDLANELLKLEGDEEKGYVGLIAKAYANRKKDEVDVISGEVINSV